MKVPVSSEYLRGSRKESEMRDNSVAFKRWLIGASLDIVFSRRVFAGWKDRGGGRSRGKNIIKMLESVALI
jgi:hypothetical protein